MPSIMPYMSRNADVQSFHAQDIFMKWKYSTHSRLNGAGGKIYIYIMLSSRVWHVCFLFCFLFCFLVQINCAFGERSCLKNSFERNGIFAEPVSLAEPQAQGKWVQTRCCLTWRFQNWRLSFKVRPPSNLFSGFFPLSSHV